MESLLGQVPPAAAASSQPLSVVVLGCDGVVGPGGIGTNFCTCCSENAGNGSRDRNGLTFTSSPCVRDLTLPNLLCRLYFSWFLGRLDTYLFFDACTIRLLVLS